MIDDRGSQFYNVVWFKLSFQPKDEKPSESEKQAQSACNVEHHNAKRNEEQSNDVTTDVDTAKTSQKQINVDPADVDTAKTGQKKSNVDAADLDTTKTSEQSNGHRRDAWWYRQEKRGADEQRRRGRLMTGWAHLDGSYIQIERQ